MSDVPEDLVDQIKALEKLFSVDQAKLKQITDHFIKELDKGKVAHICYHLARFG